MRKSASLPEMVVPSRTDPRVRPGDGLPGGGRTHGAKLPATLRSPAASAATLTLTRFAADPSVLDSRPRHGWHSHSGQEFNRTHLYNEASPQSYYWTMGKSKNHMGYGPNGSTNGKVLGTAVSGDGPDWLVGPRTFDGPFTTNTMPVRRCPDVHFNDRTGRMTYMHKTFHQGPNMDITEVHREIDMGGGRLTGTQATKITIAATPRTARSARATIPTWLAKATHNPAKDCHILHGGCVMQSQYKWG
eukprot:TRINITY_DN63097_c0_g1_i1.p1 TRINITY_DN63097_c0_g1~~TRINITY_DN63097_c0_g1_i1.p1  ORF type:complete len:258 (-),score=28.71 TRINITY_DN63097_c0_g1_i1:110-847(-)